MLIHLARKCGTDLVSHNSVSLYDTDLIHNDNILIN